MDINTTSLMHSQINSNTLIFYSCWFLPFYLDFELFWKRKFVILFLLIFTFLHGFWIILAKKKVNCFFGLVKVSNESTLLQFRFHLVPFFVYFQLLQLKPLKVLQKLSENIRITKYIFLLYFFRWWICLFETFLVYIFVFKLEIISDWCFETFFS